MLVQPTRRLFTAEEYHRMGEAGILHDDDRVELIEGEIVEMAPIGSRHFHAVTTLTHALVKAVGERALVSIQGPLRLSERTEPQPDVVLLRRRADYRARGPHAEDALLVVEVADTTLGYDRGTKLRLYARAAIPEAWIVDMAAQSNGAQRLNDLRDRSRRLAPALDAEGAFRRLDELISATLRTGSAAVARTPALRAWSEGAPYDRPRLARFEKLASVLADRAPEPLPTLPEDAPRRELLPFYEAYFSNYIEGTEFSLDEAAAIVFEAAVPAARPKDAHDILGTYRLVADDAERRRTPQTADQLVSILLTRHAIMLDARPEALPGRFKERANRAGTTLFVAPDLVEATLRAGFDAGRRLVDPFARACFLMFLVTEVHPFADGNGRIARVMMNAELTAADQVRIIIPTVYRLNYLAALKGATHNDQFEPLIATLRFAQRYTARLDLSSRTTAERDFAATNALRDANEAEDYGIRLTLPGIPADSAR